MAFGDIYELIDESELAGQKVLNVYFYRQNNLAVAPFAIDLIEAFEDQVLPQVASIQVNNVLHTRLLARNLFDETDNAEKAISVAGGNATIDYLNNFTAVGFELAQDNGAVKNGAKRYAGIDEGEQVDGIITSAGYIAALALLETALTGTLDFGIISTFLPVILKRLGPKGGPYTLPENQAEAVFGAIIDATFNPLLTSQTSRKIGVGI